MDEDPPLFSLSPVKNVTMETGPNLDFMKYFKRNVVLSGEELYDYSKRSTKMIPSKGGHKDFEPDGSWLQGKKMDMVHDTLENLLSEPRIERVSSLLVGAWDREKNLVEYKRDARKFWAKMGFVDEKRKWLYPEEALYLMEINSLEVYDGDVPLGLQQAYCIFLGTAAERNQYQVYAHLRRLGYSVVRHQGRSDITRYEQNLKLNQYKTERNHKKRKIGKNFNKSCKPEDDDIVSESPRTEENLCKRLKTENASQLQETTHDDSQSDSMTVNSLNNAEKLEDLVGTSGKQDNTEEISNPKPSNINSKPIPEKASENSQGINKISSTLISQEMNLVKVQNKKESSKILDDSTRNIESYLISESENTSLSCDSDKNSNSRSYRKNNPQVCSSWFEKIDHQSSSTSDNSGRLSPNFLSDMKKLRVLNDDKEPPCKMFMYPTWNFQEYNFPNFAHLTKMTCFVPEDSVTVPLLGEPLPKMNFDFNIQEYRETVMNQHRFHRSSRVTTEKLEFSFLKNFQSRKKAAKDWTEYKKICELENQEKMSESPLDFLWQGEVKPLVAPENATSTDAVLKKLKIVHHAQLHVCSMSERSSQSPEKWTVVFDVYRPNAKFKKTNPGLPYFRVCVCGANENPPTISDVIQLSRYFADDVPVNWAVVDNGEISFYIFRGVKIPEKP